MGLKVGFEKRTEEAPRMNTGHEYKSPEDCDKEELENVIRAYDAGEQYADFPFDDERDSYLTVEDYRKRLEDIKTGVAVPPNPEPDEE